jgi:hypothetical protein
MKLGSIYRKCHSSTQQARSPAEQIAKHIFLAQNRSLAVTIRVCAVAAVALPAVARPLPAAAAAAALPVAAAALLAATPLPATAVALRVAEAVRLLPAVTAGGDNDKASPGGGGSSDRFRASHRERRPIRDCVRPRPSSPPRATPDP